MKKKITVTETFKHEIEVELPHFYKHDLCPDDGDSVIYGAIYDDKTYTIHTSSNAYGREKQAIFGISKTSMVQFSCYFADQFKSNEREFLEARSTAAKFCNEFFKLG